jgi:hypothetical protein
MDDRDFLRGLYAAGARDSFDILAAHPYPFGHPPDDPRGAHGGLVFARLSDLREIMVLNGDTAKPIWITEFGYLTHAPAEFAHLQVSEDVAARELPRAYQIARTQMPFVEMFTVWNLARDLPPDDEQAGYNLLRADGSPKPAYEAIRALEKESPLAGFTERLWDATRTPPSPSVIPILARDAIVHLGDSEYPLPWMPLYRTRNPSAEWVGEFFLTDRDLREGLSEAWWLTLETMQVNDLNNRVLVNAQDVTPPFLPTEDFTSQWVSAQLIVPVNLLRVGRNTVTVHAGKLFPAFQQLGYMWDDFQLRNVSIHKPPHE